MVFLLQKRVNINMLWQHIKTQTKTNHLSELFSSWKNCGKSGSSETKITYLYYFIYTKTDALTSRKIFNFIASKSAVPQALKPNAWKYSQSVIQNPAYQKSMIAFWIPNYCHSNPSTQFTHSVNSEQALSKVERVQDELVSHFLLALFSSEDLHLSSQKPPKKQRRGWLPEIPAAAD